MACLEWNSGRGGVRAGKHPWLGPLFPDAFHGQDFAYISSQPHWDQSLLLPIYFGALVLWQ